jgi:PIN domain nuclease of toxin-antitoxin system
MNLLLDTHTLIWWLRNSRNLGRRTRGLIEDQANDIWISAASIWEMCIKASLERLHLAEGFDAELAEEMERSGFRELRIEFDHAFAVRYLPRHHTDPFDRILVAQAQCEGLTLVTADAEIPAYGIPVIDASL